ncbi:hypothetical protein [Modestobacter sp. URMC 112]
MSRGVEPPAELIRYPVAQHAAGNFAGFEKWLRARQRWRASHNRPLPRLYARDRHALATMPDLDPKVVSAEQAAPVAAPEWVGRSRARGLT